MTKFFDLISNNGGYCVQIGFVVIFLFKISFSYKVLKCLNNESNFCDFICLFIKIIQLHIT